MGSIFTGFSLFRNGSLYFDFTIYSMSYKLWALLMLLNIEFQTTDLAGMFTLWCFHKVDNYSANNVNEVCMMSVS